MIRAWKHPELHYLSGKEHMSDASLEDIQERMGYRFRDSSILQTALIHSSYANEYNNSLEHNERLEFLGDAVLELIVSEALYLKYPRTREGDLTRMRARLVSEPALAEMARRLGLQEHLYLGRGEEIQGGRERDAILCDALESILGAIFLDSGFQQAKEVILRLFSDMWPSQIRAQPRKDAKSRLQEITQKQYQERPRYVLQDSFGPEHAKTYRVELILPDGRSKTADASSLKKAEQLAAEKALQDIQDTEQE
jgi:ribonuclease-3